MRRCTLLCDSSRLLIYHKSEPRTPVLLESGALGILVRAFQVLQHHRTYLLSYTPRVRDTSLGGVLLLAGFFSLQGSSLGGVLHLAGFFSWWGSSRCRVSHLAGFFSWRGSSLGGVLLLAGFFSW